MTSAPPLLSVRGVMKTYGRAEASHRALDDVSLDVLDNESLAIVGPSGSGKSTLLHLMARLDIPDSGTISYRGTDVTTMKGTRVDRLRNQDFGFVFQSFHLDYRLSVYDNVALPLMIAGVKSSQRILRVRETLEALGLADRLNSSASSLSGGQKQRVAIARAIINSPSVLFADEPTGALDSVTGETVSDLLFELNRDRGLTLVVVTHSTSFADRFTRKVVLADGRITTKTPSEVRSL